jgi:iron-sulfur cluster assembly accessory protein
MITLTEAAVKKLKEMSEEMEIGHLTIRLSIKSGGCAGFQKDLCFDDITNEMDEITEQDGIKIVVDSVSLQYLEGTTVDYEEGLMSSGFRIESPLSSGSCGCGKSVAF